MERSDSEGVKPGARLTERDRALLGLLATARYLTTEQIGRLVFPGRAESIPRKRLVALAGEGRRRVRFEEALVRRLAFRDFEGRLTTVWGLTAFGYAHAERVLRREFAVPKQDIGADFLEHTVTLNELYVELLARPVVAELARIEDRLGREASALLRRKALEGLYARPEHAHFRWHPTESVRLPWQQYDTKVGKTRERLIQPDAVLELPSERRRIFVECEMGTHSIVPSTDAKAGATLAKVERYADYVMSPGGFNDNYYLRTYPDRFSPEVLFLVVTAGRAQSVNAAIAEWGRGQGATRLMARAFTLEESLAGVGRFVWRNLPEVPPARPTPKAGTGLVAGELEAVRRFYAATVAAFKQLRATARDHGQPPLEYPTGTQEVLAMLKRADAGCIAERDK